MADYRRKRKAENDDGPPDETVWIVTFADIFTLVLTFFVLMFASSTIETEKLVNTFSYFLGDVSSISYEERAKEGLTTVKNETIRGGEGEVEKAIAEMTQKLKGAGINIVQSVRITDKGVVLAIPSEVMFKSGSDEISEAGAEDLKKIAKEFIKKSKSVIFEGYTDNVPISNARFQSNWDLSLARAISALNLVLSADGSIEPKKLSVAGYADLYPLMPNNTPEGRAKNRRIELVLEGYVVSEQETKEAESSGIR